MNSLLKKPTAWIPLIISLTGIALILGYVALFGIVRHEDENMPARFFQLLTFAQILIILFFAVKWFPQMPKQTLQVLTLQIVSILIPIFLIIFLEL